MTHQGRLQSSVEDIELSLSLVVESLHKVLLGFFPVTQLTLSQGRIVENLWQETVITVENLSESFRAF